MNSVPLKNHLEKEKGYLKQKGIKKSFLSRVPAATALSNEEQELLRVTLDARDEWIQVSTNFEYVHEEMLIDYYTYRLKACEARYAYFIKLVKEKGLSHYI
jgi:hypothetical protein